MTHYQGKVRDSAARQSTARAGWTLADQAVSSVASLMLSVLVARGTDASSFGAFAVATGVYLFLRGLSAAVCCEPHLVRHSGATRSAAAAAGRSAIGASLALGCACGAVLALTSRLLLHGTLQSACTAMAVCLPILLSQDALRYHFFATAQPRAAFANDALWVVLQIGFVVASIELWGRVDVAILAWGATAGLVVALGCLQAHMVPDPRSSLDWFRSTSDLGWRYAVEYVAGTGISPLILVLLGLVAGLDSAAGLRAAFVLMGPFRILLLAALAGGVTEGIRRYPSGRPLLRYCWAISCVLAAAAVGYAVVLYLLPTRAGTALMGDAWLQARSVVLLVGLGSAAAGVQSGMLVGLRVLAAARRSLFARLVVAPVAAALAVAGVFTGQGLGAAAGLALGTMVGALVTARQLIGAVATHRGEKSSSPPEQRRSRKDVTNDAGV